MNKRINKMNSSKYMYMFTDEKNKEIIDELNRSFRVIKFSLNDFYLHNNYMQRELKTIIKEYLTFLIVEMFFVIEPSRMKL